MELWDLYNDKTGSYRLKIGGVCVHVGLFFEEAAKK